MLILVNLFNEAGYSAYVDCIKDTQLDISNININMFEVLQNRMSSSSELSYVSINNNTTKSK